MPTKPELDLALRKNRGRQIAGEWTRRLTLACRYEVHPEHFLPLEETEALKRAFNERLKANEGVVRRNWPNGSFAEIAVVMQDLAIDLRATPAVLFSSVDPYLGAVRVPGSALLLNFQSVWQVVEHDFSLVTPDLQNGLCVETNFYDAAGSYIQEGIYELAGWGKFSPPNTRS